MADLSKEGSAVGGMGLNIPAGEAFMAPLGSSAGGCIRIPGVVIPGFGRGGTHS